ncbi:MAG: murein L,D-transpeptidase, partial [Paracoccaceae bacterium]
MQSASMLAGVAFSALVSFGCVAPSWAASTETFSMTVAEASADDQAVSAFYQSRAYEPLWTGAEDAARRAAFFQALDHVEDHGLPASRYDAAGLRTAFAAVQSEHQRAKLEVAVTKAFLTYARDVQTGFLIPSKVDAGIVREVPVREPRAMLDQFAVADPAAFLASLPPATAQYAALQKARLDLVTAIANGGWGAPVPASRLEPGDEGGAVVALRDRLVAERYMAPSVTRTFDGDMQRAVQLFQMD